MKKLATLLIAAGLVFGASTGANAIDFKAKGEWLMSFELGQGGKFAKSGNGLNGYNGSQDEFKASQRVRLQLNAIASENLMGHLFFEIGNNDWGNASSGGALGADDVCIELRRAYIDWMIPETDVKVRMGIQGMALPSFTMGKSQVFEDDVAGITVSAKFTDNVGLTAFWARPANDNYAGDDDGHADYMDNLDAFGLTIPLTFDGVKVTPWGMIAAIGPNALESGKISGATSAAQTNRGLLPVGVSAPSDLDKYATAWWAGLTADITAFDPFRIAFDFMYGSVDWEGGDDYDRAGWLAALLLEYKLDWGIPGIVAWYGSGDDDDPDNGSERLPFLSVGNGDNTFSNFAFDGNQGIGREATFGNSMAGTWGVGIRLRDFSFIENLKHTFRINLIGGTNDPDMVDGESVKCIGSSGTGREALYLSTKDTAWEIGLTNTYKMYDNFQVVVDAAYMALDINSDNAYSTSGNGYQDAWNVNVYFKYSF